jgi:hypothetical protein
MILYLRHLNYSTKINFRNDKHCQQSITKENQHKISCFFIYQQRLSLKKKIPGNNLTKEFKDLYNEKYKTLKKENEEDTR